MKNKNNVEGRQIMTHYGFQFIPECCDDCQHLDYDSDDYHILFYYCLKNIWFPTKKGVCKKQERMKQGVDKDV